MKLRVHHFFDIIRDFGSGKEIIPYHYGHSYHKVAELVRKKPAVEIELVVGCDAVCEGCDHKVNCHCVDTIDHRKDFTSKEKFNDWLDERILQKLSLKEGDRVTPKILCEKADLYLGNIEWIYKGNDIEHTKARKVNVEKGLKYYRERHR